MKESLKIDVEAIKQMEDEDIEELINEANNL